MAVRRYRIAGGIVGDTNQNIAFSVENRAVNMAMIGMEGLDLWLWQLSHRLARTRKN